MAIKPRSNNRIYRPRGNDGLFHPTNGAAHKDEGTRDIESLHKNESKARHHIALHSVDNLDMEEIEAIVSIMKQKGSIVYHVSCKERCDIANDKLVSLWRQMLVNWMFYVVDCCKLQRHAVAAAAYFLDVAILRDLCKTRAEHQLAAATALQMALKTFDTAVIKLDKLVKLGRGLFTAEDVAVMERKIIASLNWNLHPPTIYCFLRQYEQLAPTLVTDSTLKVLNKVLKIMLEEMTLDERYMKYCPSIQCLAAMTVALDFVPDDYLPSCLRQTFESRLSTMTDTKEDSRELSRVHKNIYKTLKKQDKFQAIIDITSTKTKGARMYQKVLQKAENNSKKTTRRKNKNTCEQHSPRDVKAKIRIKI